MEIKINIFRKYGFPEIKKIQEEFLGF